MTLVRIQFLKDISTFVEHKRSVRMIILIPPNTCDDFSVGYFDGVAKDELYGSRMILYIKKDHYVCLIMVVGVGSNTREEYLACWGLLWFARKIKTLREKVFCESTCVID